MFCRCSTGQYSVRLVCDGARCPGMSGSVGRTSVRKKSSFLEGPLGG